MGLGIRPYFHNGTEHTGFFGLYELFNFHKSMDKIKLQFEITEQYILFL